jgi:pimeloyl-ACP methyl ester carboxylesterase
MRLHDDLPNSRMVIIERCGHMPQEERPNDTARAIVENAAFLQASP